MKRLSPHKRVACAQEIDGPEGAPPARPDWRVQSAEATDTSPAITLVSRDALNAVATDDGGARPILHLRCQDGSLSVFVLTGVAPRPRRDGVSTAVYIGYDDRVARGQVAAIGSGPAPTIFFPQAEELLHRLMGVQTFSLRFRSAGGDHVSAMFDVRRLSLAAERLFLDCPSAAPELPMDDNELSALLAGASDPDDVHVPGVDGVLEPVRVRIGTPRAPTIEGRAVLRVIVETDGDVTIHEILSEKPEGRRVGKTIARWVEGWRYEPATKDGQPVRAIITVVIDLSVGSMGFR